MIDFKFDKIEFKEIFLSIGLIWEKNKFQNISTVKNTPVEDLKCNKEDENPILTEITSIFDELVKKYEQLLQRAQKLEPSPHKIITRIRESRSNFLNVSKKKISDFEIKVNYDSAKLLEKRIESQISQLICDIDIYENHLKGNNDFMRKFEEEITFATIEVNDWRKETHKTTDNSSWQDFKILEKEIIKVTEYIDTNAYEENLKYFRKIYTYNLKHSTWKKILCLTLEIVREKNNLEAFLLVYDCR